MLHMRPVSFHVAKDRKFGIAHLIFDSGSKLSTNGNQHNNSFCAPFINVMLSLTNPGINLACSIFLNMWKWCWQQSRKVSLKTILDRYCICKTKDRYIVLIYVYYHFITSNVILCSQIWSDNILSFTKAIQCLFSLPWLIYFQCLVSVYVVN